jgi:N-methylhydantoinase A/oxoprolinase/acetone carboxylase beta subunit
VNQRKVRIGIDVGGTFTHAVAIDSHSMELIGQVKVPTTHTAQEGVAKGIIDSLNKLLEESNIAPEEVAFIAHSTTQATNALLEGDVAEVGIIGMAKGMEKIRAKSETNIPDIELAPGRFLKTHHRFLESTEGLSEEFINKTIDELQAEGAKVIVAAESFSVDDPANELTVLEICAQKGIPATATHEISQLYGLKIRTRTAVINASMLVKMMETANMTEASVKKAGIKAPLMIMRSDGGVMDISQMRKRPILTMLSGPAAGVAAALMYAHISDGIFLEVGGTSTDISAIQNGKALIKTAEVGGHRVYLRTLDVRTIGIAGGSMVRVSNGKVEDVGPRSAHIAGLGYASFSKPEDFSDSSMKTIQPKQGDPSDYIYIEGKGGAKASLTPTCASNLLGMVPEDNCALGNLDTIKNAFAPLAKELKVDAKKAAEMIMEKAAPKAVKVVDQLLKEYKLDTSIISLIGGGGGAAAIVPYTAKMMKMRHAIAQNAAVISAIGVALAMVRDTIEKSVINPTNEDILKIRREAEEAVQKMGASPDTIEVFIEIDPQKNILRATATGSTELRARNLKDREMSLEKRIEQVAISLRVSSNQVNQLGQTEYLDVFGAEVIEKKIWGLYKKKNNSIRVVDKEGIIRLQMSNSHVIQTTKESLDSALRKLIDEHTGYGDAGRELPNIFLVSGAKIVDLSGLLEIEKITSFAHAELSKALPDSPVVCLVNLR